jgi:hypothetical protein
MEWFYLQAALIAIVTLVAWMRGTGEHRWVTTTIAVMFVANTLVALLAGRASDFSGVPLHRVALDVIALAIFIYLWSKSDNWWVLWICSAQLLSVVAHLARILKLPLPPLGYAVMEMWPVWLVIIVTAISLANRVRRQRSVPIEY